MNGMAKLNLKKENHSGEAVAPLPSFASLAVTVWPALDEKIARNDDEPPLHSFGGQTSSPAPPT